MKTLKAGEAYRAGCERFEGMTPRLPRRHQDVDNAQLVHSAVGYQSNEFDTKLRWQVA